MSAFDLIERKQKIGTARADQIELPVLIYFDAARTHKRCPPAGYNHIAYHLVLAYYLAKVDRSPSFCAICDYAGEAWRKAGGRAGNDLALTAKEYKIVRACLGVYFRKLPYIEQGVYQQAVVVVDRIMRAV